MLLEDLFSYQHLDGHSYSICTSQKGFPFLASYLINELSFSAINMQFPFSSLYDRDFFLGEITTIKRNFQK